MERFVQIAEFWQWLPAFRAVAETEHLPTAAEILGVGPSALSRSIRLLERAIGRPLFERAGHRLRLDARGRELLATVRDAMRLVDDGVQRARGDTLRGRLSIASAGAITSAFVIPALRQLRAEHPELHAVVDTHQPHEIAGLLLRGALDVAFQSVPVHAEGLVTKQLGMLRLGVYCGPGHPLRDAEAVTIEQLLEHAFVGPPPDENGNVLDGWPIEVPRRFALHVDQMRVGYDACLGGDVLALLPDALVAPRGDALRRLPIDPASPMPVLAIHRAPVGDDPGAAGAMVDAVHAFVKEWCQCARPSLGGARRCRRRRPRSSPVGASPTRKRLTTNRNRVLRRVG